MPHYQSPHRSATPPSYPTTDYYPGLNPYEVLDLAPLKAEASAFAPFAQGGSSLSLPAAAATETTTAAATSGSGFSLANLGGMIEKFGGIEGILSTVGKVQKVMQTVQQFAPMAKMIAGLIPGKKGAKLLGGNSGGALDEYRPRRRRGKKSRRGTSKSGSGSRGRKKTGKRRR